MYAQNERHSFIHSFIQAEIQCRFHYFDSVKLKCLHFISLERAFLMLVSLQTQYIMLCMKCDIFLYFGIFYLNQVPLRKIKFPFGFSIYFVFISCVLFFFPYCVARLVAPWQCKEQEKCRFSAHFWTSSDDALHSNSQFKQRHTNSGK